MEQRTIDELRAGFEIQIKYQFYKKPEFPFLHSMGIWHVFFPVKDEQYDFGFLILEYMPEQNKTWVGTWVDTEEQLKSYKYRRDYDIINPVKIAEIFAQKVAEIHHKQVLKQREDAEEWRKYETLHKSDTKPYLN